MALMVATGRIEDSHLKEQVSETIRVLRERGASLILVDCAEALSQATLPALYYLPDHATAIGAPWHLRIAVVLPKTGYRVDTFRFFELVFKSAGYDIQLFNTREAAEVWLLHPPSPKRGINQLTPA